MDEYQNIIQTQQTCDDLFCEGLVEVLEKTKAVLKQSRLSEQQKLILIHNTLRHAQELVETLVNLD